MSVRSSPKRRGPPLRYQITFGVHAPPSSDMHSVSGHEPGGSTTLLLRMRNAIRKLRRRLPCGYYNLSGYLW
jgi:hypothetical protein